MIGYNGVSVHIYYIYNNIYIYMYISRTISRCYVQFAVSKYFFLFFSFLFFFPSRRLIDRMNDDATRVSMSMRYTYVYNMYMRAWMYCSNVHKVIINVRTIDIIARVRRVLFIRMCVCVCVYIAHIHIQTYVYTYIYGYNMHIYIYIKLYNITSFFISRLISFFLSLLL